MAAVDGALQAWVHAMFVARAGFEAYFAVRGTPGTYARSRAMLSAPELRTASPGSSSDEWLDDLWWLDQLAGEF